MDYRAGAKKYRLVSLIYLGWELLCVAYIVCTSNLDLVSFLFLPALYSTLKLEIFLLTRYIIVGKIYNSWCNIYTWEPPIATLWIRHCSKLLKLSEQNASFQATMRMRIIRVTLLVLYLIVVRLESNWLENVNQLNHANMLKTPIAIQYISHCTMWHILE